MKRWWGSLSPHARFWAIEAAGIAALLIIFVLSFLAGIWNNAEDSHGRHQLPSNQHQTTMAMETPVVPDEQPGGDDNAEPVAGQDDRISPPPGYWTEVNRITSRWRCCDGDGCISPEQDSRGEAIAGAWRFEDRERDNDEENWTRVD